MTRIEAFEKAIENKDFDIYNWTLLSSYDRTKRTGNEMLDFQDCIWEKDIEQIAKGLDDNNITSFTISSSFSGLPTVLMLFQEKGYRLQGMVRVETGRKDWMTDEPEMVPAVLLKKEI